jgi:DNA topoisomerase I
MYLRPGKYGPWLGCSKFPKCRGRGDFKKLPEGEQKKLLGALEAHQKAHPSVVIKTLGGSALTGADGKALAGAMVLGQKEESAAVAVIGDE